MDRDYDALAARYVSVWNEADADARRNLVRQVWCDGGAHISPLRAYCGEAALLERVEGAHGQFVRDGGFRFALDGAGGHDDAMWVRWTMRPAAGGEVAAAGRHFFLLDADDRIRLDYQFNEPTPAA